MIEVLSFVVVELVSQNQLLQFCSDMGDRQRTRIVNWSVYIIHLVGVSWYL